MAASAATNPVGPYEEAELVTALYKEYADKLARYCRGLLGSGQEAEDAVQSTFVHAVQALRNGVVPECESAWLHTIAKHVCLAQLRSTGDRARRTSDVELETISAPEGADDDLARGLNAALASLPERQRRALFLREWLGLSSHEVAGRLGMRTSETYALLTRARRGMATALSATIGRGTAAINLGTLLLKLRALLFGGAAKTATTAAVVVAMAGGAVAVERAAVRDPAPGAAPRTVVETSFAGVTEPRLRIQGAAAAASPRPAISVPPRRSRPVASRGPSAPTATGERPSPAPAPEREPSPSGTTPTEASVPPTSTSPARATTPAAPKVDLGRTQAKIEALAPPELAALVPPLDETVDELVTPEVRQVVEAVDETLSSVTGVVPPPPPPSPVPPLLP
jgi:RNA polymerase sigma-70 factor, ECF subfamily